MNVRFESPEELGKPFGAYSQVARRGELAIIAGQVGMTKDRHIPTGVGAQAELAYTNVATALGAVDLHMSDVLKFTTYLTSADDIPEFNEARDRLFPALFPSGVYPANTLLVVDRLVLPDLRIEIDAFAHA